MAELKTALAVKYGIIAQTEFAKERGNITLSALDYAMDKDLIDFTRVGNVRFIVLTPKTQEYKPNASSKRQTTIMQT